MEGMNCKLKWIGGVKTCPGRHKPSGHSRGILCVLKGAEDRSYFHRALLDLREKNSTAEVMGKSETGWRIPRENELIGSNQKKSIIVTVHRCFIISYKIAFIFRIQNWNISNLVSWYQYLKWYSWKRLFIFPFWLWSSWKFFSYCWKYS